MNYKGTKIDKKVKGLSGCLLFFYGCFSEYMARFGRLIGMV